MTLLRDIKTTFTAGEVSRELLGRGDLRAYGNGALTLRNVFINPTGGVTRRAGLAYVDTAPGAGKLIAFEFNTQQTYLLVVTNLNIDIYEDDVKIATVTAPWTLAQIPQLAWTQSADTLLLTHPDVPPKKLVRSTGGVWSLNDWTYFTETNNLIRQPYFKFVDSGVSLAPSGTSGTITIDASASVFTSSHVGTRLRFTDKELLVTGYTSPTRVTVSVLQNLPSTANTIDWKEQAFSAVRGYPATVAFHQDRLVIGGSRDLPNRLWFSRSGDLFNFNLGTGLDDEAIEFSVLSDQVNAIRGIFSGRHLQVFTSGAEWMVTGDPLTPAAVQIRRQTRVGSAIDRYIPPVTVDGATLFVSRNRTQIQEFLYTDVEQAYQSTDLALLSRHIPEKPVDQDYDQRRRLLFVVREDGKFATLTVFRAEQVAAWTLHETDGTAQSVAVVGEDVYLMVLRNGGYRIERLDDDLNLDSAMTGTNVTPTVTWSGLSHLNGKTVSVLGDGILQADKTVSGGSVTIATAASSIQIGLPYTHIIEPLPPGLSDAAGSAKKSRLIRAAFRLQDTAALKVDLGNGLKNIPLGSGAPLPLVSGDYAVRALGWRKSNTDPLWRIEQSTPLPFTLLSVAAEVQGNG